VRKRYILGALFGALVVALSGSALSLAKQGKGKNHKFDFTYTSTKAGAATGISKILTDRFNYVAPPSGQTPNPVTKIVFKEPKGTKLDSSVLGSKKKLDACTEKRLGSSGDPVAAKCPKLNKKLGKATAITGISAVPSVDENVNVYGATNQFVVRITPKSGGLGQTANIFIKVSGRTLVTKVPTFCNPGDNTATPQCDSPLGESVLKRLEVSIKLIKKGKKPFITYGSCKRNGATNKTTATYTFRSTPKETVTSTQKCRT
jgi:hypothetical protein